MKTAQSIILIECVLVVDTSILVLFAQSFSRFFNFSKLLRGTKLRLSHLILSRITIAACKELFLFMLKLFVTEYHLPLNP